MPISPLGGKCAWRLRSEGNWIRASAASSRGISKRALRRKIVGQDEAVQAVVDLYQVFRAGLNSPGRPVGNLAVSGADRSGEDARRGSHGRSFVRRSARGDQGGLRRISALARNCEADRLASGISGASRDASADHAGSAGAVSHRKTEDLSFLLFDEIEKASDALWQLLLGILDKATLTLGDNRRVDLSQTMIFMTSNLGGGEITELMTGGMGFAPVVPPESKPRLDEKVERTASEAAKRKFAPEFMNRIDKVVVFHPLRSEQLEQILEIELGMVQQRVLETAKGRFLFRVTPAGAGISAARRDGPEIRSAAPEARDRAAPGVSAGEFAGDRTSEPRRRALDRLGRQRSGTEVLEGRARCGRPSDSAHHGESEGGSRGKFRWAADNRRDNHRPRRANADSSITLKNV